MGLLQAQPDVGQRRAAAWPALAGRGRTRHAGARIVGQRRAATAVDDADPERAAVDPRIDANCAAGDLRLESVDDGVLDQRLQRQRRQRQRPQRRGHVDAVLEPVLHADLDDAQVGVDEIDLVAEGVAGVAEARERRPQVVDEGFEHQLGAHRVAVHQRGHVGQRVEEEVRFDLRLQEAKLRFGGRVLGLDLARLGPEELLEDGHDEHGDEHAAREQLGPFDREEGAHVDAHRQQHAERPAQRDAEHRHDHEVDRALPRPGARQPAAADGVLRHREGDAHRKADAQADDDVDLVPRPPRRQR